MTYLESRCASPSGSRRPTRVRAGPSVGTLNVNPDYGLHPMSLAEAFYAGYDDAIRGGQSGLDRVLAHGTAACQDAYGQGRRQTWHSLMQWSGSRRHGAAPPLTGSQQTRTGWWEGERQ